jgi:hypothetical protein
MTFYEFALKFTTEHPWFTLLILLALWELASLPFKTVNRVIRHRNIAKAGWPPEHVDADGDPVTE